jgi:hypothetical protein
MATARSEIGRTFWSEWSFRRSLDVEEGSWFDTTLLSARAGKHTSVTTESVADNLQARAPGAEDVCGPFALLRAGMQAPRFAPTLPGLGNPDLRHEAKYSRGRLRKTLSARSEQEAITLATATNI